MFSCCALFAQKDEPTDMEHLKALDEVSIAMDEHGMTGSSDWEGTPAVSSPRDLAALDDSASAAQIAEAAALRTKLSTTKSEVEDKAEAAAKQARLAEAEAAATEETRAAAQIEADTATTERTEQTLRALREAEDAAHAAAAEAEQRRFEEESSARAARQAESEARKALWRAEEAQREKERAIAKAAAEAAEVTAAVQRMDEEEAELIRRKATAAMMEEAKEYLRLRLLSDEGLRLQKHGRNGKSMFRTLRCPDPKCETLTWGKMLHDLRLMQEVRTGTDPDPSSPSYTGTSELRRSKAGSVALERSFSLLFPSRSLDFTVASKDECERLVMGFRAMLVSQRVY